MKRLWSEEAGDASHPLIVLVHGAMDRSGGMLRLSRCFDEEFRVLRYDRRGYGRSTPHDGPFRMAEQVDDLVALLAGRRAVLVGHSYGGNVALATAARHPALVAGISLYETPLSWEPWWPSTTAGAHAIAAARDPAAAAEAFMVRLIGEERWESLPERTRAARRSEGPALVAELADLRAHAPWDAAAVAVPVFAGYGTRGAAHHRHGMSHLAGSIAGAVLVELDECGHGAPMSHPDIFRERLVDPMLRAVGAPWG